MSSYGDMMSTAVKSKPSKWKKIVSQVKASGKGGSPGQWSARKAQLEQRLLFLQSLATWGTFGRGWGKRVVAVRHTAMDTLKG